MPDGRSYRIPPVCAQRLCGGIEDGGRALHSRQGGDFKCVLCARGCGVKETAETQRETVLLFFLPDVPAITVAGLVLEPQHLDAEFRRVLFLSCKMDCL